MVCGRYLDSCYTIINISIIVIFLVLLMLCSFSSSISILVSMEQADGTDETAEREVGAQSTLAGFTNEKGGVSSGYWLGENMCLSHTHTHYFFLFSSLLFLCLDHAIIFIYSNIWREGERWGNVGRGWHRLNK